MLAGLNQYSLDYYLSHCRNVTRVHVRACVRIVFPLALSIAHGSIAND